MGRHKINKSLKQQVKERLDAKLAIGKSKYAAKLNGTYLEYIFSWDTYRSYMRHCCYFVSWVKQQPTDPLLGHKPRTLKECRIFAERWIQHNIDRGQSAYTIKLELSALAKLYGCKTTDFDITTPERKRCNITRSRGESTADKHFSLENNKELITFCKCTGLRRAELSQIRGTDLVEHESMLCLDVKRGTKGGRLRISPVIGSSEEIATVKRICADAGEKKIFPKPSKNADIHSYRAEYATRIYNHYKRDFQEFKNERLIVFKNKIVDSYISKGGKKLTHLFPELYTVSDGTLRMLPGYRDVSSAYYFRSDLKGMCCDRKALFEVSRALGHNREVVVADHYVHF